MYCSTDSECAAAANVDEDSDSVQASEATDEIEAEFRLAEQ